MEPFAAIKRKLRAASWQVVLSPPLTKVYDRIQPFSSLGPRGERLAERFLLRQGMIIIARGYQDKFGEIDLIAVDGRTLVFVEVKTRSGSEDSNPAEAVDSAKQEKLTKTAIGFLKFQNLLEVSARFDVIAIKWGDDFVRPDITHYQNAFEPVGQGNMFA